MATEIDVNAEDHGSIILLQGLTDAGREWLDENVECEFSLGNGIPCEPRYRDDILHGADADGLQIGIDGTPVSPA